MADIMTPALGESVTEATVARWAKKPGEAVKKDEVLVELETDKVNLEVAAPEDGVLADIAAEEGATVEPGQVLGHLAAAGTAPAKAKPAPAREAEALVSAPAAAAAPAGELQPEPQPGKPAPRSAPVPDLQPAMAEADRPL